MYPLFEVRSGMTLECKSVGCLRYRRGDVVKVVGVNRHGAFIPESNKNHRIMPTHKIWRVKK